MVVGVCKGYKSNDRHNIMHFDQEQCYSNYYKSFCELYDIYTYAAS